jgi:hypothetical protein
VRQGDPLSCLLFDVAIEPLACVLRSDGTLTDFRVPGGQHKILVNLFADDTLVYLNTRDKYGHLIKVLHRWCTALGAKFNKGKTEVVPITTPEFRAKVAQDQGLSEDNETFNKATNVMLDGLTI